MDILEPNMYVRTNDGYINKIKKVNQYNVLVDARDLFGEELNIPNNEIIKASHNIIDLIQVGDYVNGGRVVEHTYQPGRLFVECIYVGGKEQTTIENYSWELTSKYVEDEPDAIKSIVTKEMFESMSYKVQD